MKSLIFLFTLLVLISCKDPSVDDREFNIDDPDIPSLKLTEVCLNGVIYYVGYYVTQTGKVYGGPMTPKYVQDNLFPVQCENNI